MDNSANPTPSFLTRLSTAISCFGRVLSDASFSAQVAAWLRGSVPDPARAKPVEVPPERAQASGLQVLAMLQREGRWLDFLQEDVTAYPDADVGAAARVVHAGCRKVLAQWVRLEPVLKEKEGDSVTVPAGFDPQRIRLTGNVAGQPPFRGLLKHHGWVTHTVQLPAVSPSMDPRVLAPAEVELA